MKVKSLSRVRLLATPRTAAHQAPPSMGFSRQEYWSGLPLPSPKIASRNLLCITGKLSLVLCDDLEEWDGGGGKREVQVGGRHVYIWLIHFIMQQRLIQHYKAMIPN